MRRVMLVVVLTVTMLLPAVAATAATEEVTVKAEGMYCVNCEARVESALGGLEGVQSVSADRKSETAHVTYDPAKVTPEDMVATIDNHTAYVGGMPDEDGAEATAEEDADAESASADGDTDSASGDGEEDSEVASAVVDPASSSQEEGAGVLPMGSLVVAGGAVLVLVIAGGAWMALRR